MIHPSMLETLIPDQVPGIALGIVTPTTITTHVVGYSALVPHREVLKADTRYDLASLTKVVITTTIILQLIDEGRLDFSTPIQAILPAYSHPQTTVGDLLTHQSGLPADDPTYKSCQDAMELRHFTLTHPLSVEPRTRVIYTDFGFLILGWVIEALEGPLDKVAKRRIAQPLGLTTLGYKPEASQVCAPTEVSVTRGVIRGVVHDGKAFLMNGVAGNAGCFATLQDLCVFTQSFLDDRQRLLSKASMAQLRQTHTVGLDFKRTWGWYRHDPSCAFGHQLSEDCLFHTGFTGTSIAIDFTKQVGVVILTNRIHPTRDNPHITAIRNTVHDAVFSEFE
jgi:CubicO group peptidase (beta-lactamase class C family)